MAPKTFDLERAHPAYYQAGTEPSLISLEKLPFLAINGSGSRHEPGFMDRVEALFELASALENVAAHEEGQPFEIAPMEALWWAREDELPASLAGSRWRYRLLTRIPRFIEEEHVHQARETAIRHGADKTLIAATQHATLEEGACVQILHVGPTEEVTESYERLHAYMHEHGYAPAGRYHEIYLESPADVNGSQLRTICRIPVKRE